MSSNSPKIDAVAETSGDTTPPRGSSLIKGLWSKPLATAVLALLVPFIALSESSLKAIYSSWFDECRLVIEKDSAIPAKDPSQIVVPVRLIAIGTAPATLNLGFSTRTRAALRSVIFERDFDSENLAFHALAGQPCPGDLCKDDTSLTASNAPFTDIVVHVTNFHQNLSYTFSVLIEQGSDNLLAEGDLDVFVRYTRDQLHRENGINPVVCRVELASVFNIWPRLGPWSKFTLFCIVFLILTTITVRLRSAAQ